MSANTDDVLRTVVDAEVVLTGEAAHILGVSAETVRVWERKGWLQATRTAHGIRLFKRRDVELARDKRVRRYQVAGG